MELRIIGYTLGALLTVLGLSEMIPGLVELTRHGPNAQDFFLCGFGTMFVGGALFLANRSFFPAIGVRQAFLLTCAAWFFMSLFAAFPLYFSDLRLSFTDAFFEAVSGITTTGSTVLSGLDTMSHGILLWRSMTQWIGGIGIIAFAIVFLPFLRVGGMQMFRLESSDRSEKAFSRSGDVVISLFKVYCALTIFCGLTYFALGMTPFDAVNHALTTLPTGGYSTHDASFGFFESPALQITCTIFMFIGGVPFMLYVRLFYRREFIFHQDEQFRTYVAMILVFVAFLSCWLFFTSDKEIGQSILLVAFNVVSVLTTTGYATADYLLWGPLAVIFFFFLTYLGACAGSTTGGLKVMRLLITSKSVIRQTNVLLLPNGVFTLKYQGRLVEQKVILTVLAFLSLYVAANMILTIALAATGLDFVTAISAAATSVANVGPGVGDVIGPAGNFGSLPDDAKWLLCGGMLIGRLEIMTVMALFSYEFWGR
ncbi:MAG: TrkH family potassium uptake protein [Alphaproteobacteria bacterium]|nr:TrkH family potassium uptake protein [Alphaproteobacteria bacterium]